jgi:hypothetical protein
MMKVGFGKGHPHGCFSSSRFETSPWVHKAEESYAAPLDSGCGNEVGDITYPSASRLKLPFEYGFADRTLKSPETNSSFQSFV